MSIDVELTLSQSLAFSALQTSKNVFVTGGAGTGKSFLIRHFRDTKEGSKIPVLASTGAAAILLGGRTFHSFFGLGIMQGGPGRVFQKALENKRLRKRLRTTDEIILDEVSMLSHEVLDCAEKICRALREMEEPWGGMRVVAVGDFAQLPPVSRGTTVKEWGFLGEAWAESEFLNFELQEVMRTEDQDFLRVLNKIRVGICDEEVSDFLEARLMEDVDVDVPHLFSRRDQTEKFNLGRLAEIDEESRIYETKYSGDKTYVETLMRDAPVPASLELKRGALVMIRVNDPKQRFVNGTVGHIKSLREDSITIDTGRRLLELEPFPFSYVDADGEERAHAINFPVTLAYASTIHKIQGATLDRAHIDLGNIWEPGQAYVALSRVRKTKDLSLIRWSPSSIKADPMVQSFYSSLVQNRKLKLKA